jgi:hypothetical protein
MTTDVHHGHEFHDLESVNEPQLHQLFQALLPPDLAPAVIGVTSLSRLSGP